MKKPNSGSQVSTEVCGEMECFLILNSDTFDELGWESEVLRSGKETNIKTVLVANHCVLDIVNGWSMKLCAPHRQCSVNCSTVRSHLPEKGPRDVE